MTTLVAMAAAAALERTFVAGAPVNDAGVAMALLVRPVVAAPRQWWQPFAWEGSEG